MKKTSIYLIILVIVLIGLVGVVIGARNELEVLSAVKQKLVVFIQDSRIINVEKPCEADEVTLVDIFGSMAIGSGDNCEKAKKRCKANAAQIVWEKAEEECQLYKKIQNREESCHAYRGNFNPDEDLRFDKCYYSNDTQTWIQICYINKGVKYVCN